MSAKALRQDVSSWWGPEEEAGWLACGPWRREPPGVVWPQGMMGGGSGSGEGSGWRLPIRSSGSSGL